MDRALSFFRIFDLAFFAPGGVLFLSLLPALRLLHPSYGTVELGTTKGLLLVVLALGMIYVLGLLTHALQRLVRFTLKRCNSRQRGSEPFDLPSWYQLVSEDTREDLATYFWYMRATCWNLAAAALLSPVLLLFGEPVRLHIPLIALIGVATAGLLVWLGFEYDRGLNRAARATAGSTLYPGVFVRGG